MTSCWENNTALSNVTYSMPIDVYYYYYDDDYLNDCDDCDDDWTTSRRCFCRRRHDVDYDGYSPSGDDSMISCSRLCQSGLISKHPGWR